MTAIVVLAVVAAIVAIVARLGADSRTGDDWRRTCGRFGGVGGPLR